LIFQIGEDGTLQAVDYKETPHNRVTRDFLNTPDAMLKILLARDDRGGVTPPSEGAHGASAP
jgi:hypothetical protein